MNKKIYFKIFQRIFALNQRNLSLNKYSRTILNIPFTDDLFKATYIWIDGSGQQLRCKTKILDKLLNKVSDYPIWNFDGSSTGQAKGDVSDIFIKPVALYKDPFTGGNAKLVLCETLNNDGSIHISNKRHSCKEIMDKYSHENPWFGIEQEYMMLELDGRPLGWDKTVEPLDTNEYYCGVNTSIISGRQIVDEHIRACYYAGVKISGTNAEVTPGQWEFQVGPCVGIDLSDQLWIARYLLARISEYYNVRISYDPKLFMSWNGSGAHTNYSTKSMRSALKLDNCGLQVLQKAISLLALNHNQHLALYDPNNGEDNKRRLTGMHETSKIEEFTSGIGSRSSSVRIPLQVNRDGCGYLEDRRPSSNCDPYVVTEAIVRTTLQ